MIDTSNPNKLLHPLMFGFETKHLYYHSDRKAAWVFNALRIASYIPVIGAIPACIVLNTVLREFIPRVAKIYQEVKEVENERNALVTRGGILETAAAKHEELRQQGLNALQSIEPSVVEGNEHVQLQLQSQIIGITKELTEMTPELHATVEELSESVEKSKARIEGLKRELPWAEKIVRVATNLFARFVLGAIGLGILFLLPDLYHTQWLSHRVKALPAPITT